MKCKSGKDAEMPKESDVIRNIRDAVKITQKMSKELHTIYERYAINGILRDQTIRRADRSLQ